MRTIAAILSITRWLCLPAAALTLYFGVMEEVTGLRQWEFEPSGALLFAATTILATGWLWMGILAAAIRGSNRICTPVYLALAVLVAGGGIVTILDVWPGGRGIGVLLVSAR